MTPAELIAAAVLETFAGPYYVAATDTQRKRVLAGAAEHIAPLIENIRREAAKQAAQNPT